MPKPQPVTKAYLDRKLNAVTRQLEKLVAFREVAASKADIREAVQHFSKRFDAIDKRFEGIEQRLDGVEAQLEAIKDSLALRREFQNLVRELRAQGITLDESRIFVA